MNEIWKRIKGFEDYEISSLGRVKSYKRDKINGRMLKPRILNSGYLFVALSNNKTKQFLIHKLVAQTFISNHENKPCVDHINTIKTDNRIENLRWVTREENMNNELTLEKLKNKKFSEEHKRKISESKQKYIYYCKELSKSFNSSKEAEDYCRSLGIKANHNHILACCKGLRKSAGKYNGVKLT